MADGAGKPIVGITTYVVPAAFGVWQLDSALVPHDYVVAVERAGGRPLLVPPSSDAVGETLDALDGLIFSGGPDLDPALYGQERHAETDPVGALRDGGELALLRGALERDLPVLAICRGSELLNVACGGDLVQHLPEAVGHERHKHTPGVFADHEVEVAEGSRLALILDGAVARHPVPVKSHHHQGLGRIGEGLRVAAVADDGTPEAVEAPERRFALGVLWHPEAGEDGRLFAALVAEAAARRAERHGAPS